MAGEREEEIAALKRALLEHREVDARAKKMREDSQGLNKEFKKSENDLKSLQSVGQIIGELLKQLDEDTYIVKASSGPRYVVGCRKKVSKAKLKIGARVTLDCDRLCTKTK